MYGHRPSGALLALAMLLGLGCREQPPAGQSPGGPTDGQAPGPDAGADVILRADQATMMESPVPDAGPALPFRACESEVRPGAACGTATLPCHAPPMSSFTCRINVCRCENGSIRCDDAPPTAEAGARECLESWSCIAEGFPVCNYDKPWYVCRCDAQGRWRCGDECKRRGCPEGPYATGGAGPRAHTGDPCTATEACPYQATPVPDRPVLCLCVSGHFQCPDEPVPDGGAPGG
jgi:hypothetical protein